VPREEAKLADSPKKQKKEQKSVENSDEELAVATHSATLPERQQQLVHKDEV
jgi:hypothetical protein